METLTQTPPATLEQIAALERQYLLQTYARYPVVLHHGKGVFLFDIEGKKYLDFVSGIGVNALGHAHPRIVKAIRDQAAKLIHVSNLYYHEYQGPLAEKLCKLSGLNRAFFSNSGTEAIEGSIKLARLAGHRTGGDAKCRLVALDGSYHGRTFGALSLTGQDKHRKGFEPLLEDVTFVKQNDLEGLRAAVNDNTCAIVLEPIFGEGGIFECSVEFLRECRAVAQRLPVLVGLAIVQPLRHAQPDQLHEHPGPDRPQRDLGGLLRHRDRQRPARQPAPWRRECGLRRRLGPFH